MRSDDLAQLFARPPGGVAQPMGYRQGLVVAWDPVTLENRIRVGGAELPNLPVLGVAEAATVKVGSVVGLADVGNTLAIIGRFVVPGSAGATEALTQLGDKIASATVATQEAANDGAGAFQDLATVGPTVTINVGASGKLLVIMSCVTGDDATGQNGGYMSFTLSGANTLAASSARSAQILVLITPNSDSVRGTITGQALLTGLNPGATEVKSKYAWGTAVGALFEQRIITAFAL